MWDEIKQAALDILRAEAPHTTMTRLDTLIVATGYVGANAPHANINHLFHVYAASLRNAGGPGPNIDAFASMVSRATDQFAKFNKLPQPLEIADFARACLEYLRSRSASPLVKEGSVDYESQLRHLGDGTGDRLGTKDLLPQLLRSVVGFSEVIAQSYGGSAATYHAHFSRPREPHAGSTFVRQMFEQLERLPRFGVAVGMNFFKDSQVCAYHGKPLSSLLAPQAGWYLKPDMHVLRFMLKWSGRAQHAGLPDDRLVTLPYAEAKRAYAQTRSTEGWPDQYDLGRGRPFNEKGVWDCIEDVHYIAEEYQIPPLEIDRVFFMAGSGRFEVNRRLAMPQEQRYRGMFQAMN
jgi:hypothetical protein